MSLDDATLGLLDRLSLAGRRPSWTLTPTEVRAGGKALATMIGPGPQMHRVLHEQVESRDGTSLAVRILLPSAAPSALIVHLHGGCWVFGNIDEADTVGRRLAAESGCAVALVGYRKAPEHPYPAAVQDAWAALTHLEQQCGRLLGRDVPLVVMGDSAGGNLAAVLALRARDRGGPDLALQVLVYPIVDCAMDTASYHDPQNQLLLRKRTMQWAWDLYAPDPVDRRDPQLSPLRAADLSGVAPAVVVTAEYDVLRDEGEAYAHRLAQVGRLQDLTRFEGQMHGFIGMIGLLPGSALGLTHLADRIRAGLD